MSLDVYNLNLKELKQLNSSLANYKSNCLMKLHNLQRVNHNLIIENTKLRQSIKYGNKFFIQSHNTFSHQRNGLEINVEMLEESVLVNFKCVLSPSEMSDYYNCDFEKLQYKVILTEWYNNILQNSSTLTTKENQLTLKSLTEGWKYMITIHLQGNDKKLSAQSEFIYKRNSNKNNNQQDKSRGSKESTESKELKESTVSRESAELRELKESTVSRESAELRELGEKLDNVRICEKEYRLNIGMDENEFVTCKFNENDSVEDVVNVFMAKNKLKSFLKDSLIQEIYNLKSSNDSIKTIDLTDLI